MTVYLQLFFVFAKIGLFGFGGGMAMLPIIYQGAKEFGLMSADEFSNLVAISQVTPGPIAVNAATYVGFNCAGYAGAFAATFGVALPSFVLVILVCGFINKFKNSRIMESAFAEFDPMTICITAVTVVLAGKFKMSPVMIVIGAGVIGALLCG